MEFQLLDINSLILDQPMLARTGGIYGPLTYCVPSPSNTSQSISTLSETQACLIYVFKLQIKQISILEKYPKIEGGIF